MYLPSLSPADPHPSEIEKEIRENYQKIYPWAAQTKTDCFRLYEGKVLIIDLYSGRFCIQYLAPTRNQPEPSEALVKETEALLKKLFNAKPSSIYWRSRTKAKETRQYEKADESKEFFTAHEYGVKFKINLKDYLDTGLFLDHRETRQLVASISKGKRLLNLFAYTASFSVHAAIAGAALTKSVDMSNTYCDWARDNFNLNRIPLKNHPIVRADCLKFLNDEVRSGAKYDIIVIDPPTISRSKKMERMFDIQKDYLFLITKALQLLSKEGVIFFSTNSRGFIFDLNEFRHCSIEEITNKTIVLDINKSYTHRCWKINS